MNDMTALKTIKPGDVIGFSGNSWTSAGVNLCSFSVPYWGLSHVGICGCDDSSMAKGLRLFDSASGAGVRSQTIARGVEGYDGKAWLYGLSRPLYIHECDRLTWHIEEMLGREYDTAGALRAGGKIWAAIQGRFRGEDLATFFCSEFVAEQLSHIGVFNTANASRWNPNHLMRTLRRLGIVQKPVRLK